MKISNNTPIAPQGAHKGNLKQLTNKMAMLVAALNLATSTETSAAVTIVGNTPTHMGELSASDMAHHNGVIITSDSEKILASSPIKETATIAPEYGETYCDPIDVSSLASVQTMIHADAQTISAEDVFDSRALVQSPRNHTIAFVKTLDTQEAESSIPKSFTPVAVPETGAAAMGLLGATMLILRRRK